MYAGDLLSLSNVMQNKIYGIFISAYLIWFYRNWQCLYLSTFPNLESVCIGNRLNGLDGADENSIIMFL